THNKINRGAVLTLTPLCRFVKNMIQYFLVLRCKTNIASLHHCLRRLKRLFCLIGSKACCPTPTKARNKVSRISTPKYISTYTYNGTRIKHGVYTTFTVVSHHKSTKLKICFNKAFRFVVPKFYCRIIIL